MHSGDIALIQLKLANKDHTTALRLAHTIKGAAATLGADKLSTMAARLEAILREKRHAAITVEEIRPALDAVDAEFVMLAAALPSSPAPSPALDTAPTNPETLNKILNELDALLKQSDTAAIKLFETHYPALGKAFGPPGKELGNQIKLFDFALARQTLQSLRQQLAKHLQG